MFSNVVYVYQSNAESCRDQNKISHIYVLHFATIGTKRKSNPRKRKRVSSDYNQNDHIVAKYTRYILLQKLMLGLYEHNQ